MGSIKIFLYFENKIQKKLYSYRHPSHTLADYYKMKHREAQREIL